LASWFAFAKEQWGLKRATAAVPETIFRLIGPTKLPRRTLARAGLRWADEAERLTPISMKRLRHDPSPFVYGWSGPEAGGRWSEGRQAILAFRDDSSAAADLFVTLWVRPFVAGARRSLRVNAIVNGILCATWRFPGPAKKIVAFTIPRLAIVLYAPALLITLDIRKPERPSNVTDSPDRRLLGLFLERIQFGYPTRDDPFAAGMEFFDDSNSDLLSQGWSTPDPQGRWTDGRRATIILQWPETEAADIGISLEGRLFPKALLGRQRLKIIANGRQARSTIEHIASGRVLFRLAARPARFDKHAKIRLDLIIRRPISPASLGVSADDRQLGFMLQRLTLKRLR
jgi:hypothetical protein